MKGKKDNDKFKDKCSEYKSHANKTFFNIFSCKCLSFSVCSCARDRKTSEREQTVLTDQRTSKKWQLEELMQLFRKKYLSWKKKSRCKLFQMKQQKSQDDELLAPETCMISTLESSTDHEFDTTEDSDYLKTPSSQMIIKLNFKTSPAKRMNLDSFASACDRTGVSDRAAAIIASFELHDWML